MTLDILKALQEAALAVEERDALKIKCDALSSRVLQLEGEVILLARVRELLAAPSVPASSPTPAPIPKPTPEVVPTTTTPRKRNLTRASHQTRSTALLAILRYLDTQTAPVYIQSIHEALSVPKDVLWPRLWSAQGTRLPSVVLTRDSEDLALWSITEWGRARLGVYKYPLPKGAGIMDHLIHVLNQEGGKCPSLDLAALTGLSGSQVCGALGSATRRGDTRVEKVSKGVYKLSAPMNNDCDKPPQKLLPEPDLPTPAPSTDDCKPPAPSVSARWAFGSDAIPTPAKTSSLPQRILEDMVSRPWATPVGCAKALDADPTEVERELWRMVDAGVAKVTGDRFSLRVTEAPDEIHSRDTRSLNVKRQAVRDRKGGAVIGHVVPIYHRGVPGWGYERRGVRADEWWPSSEAAEKVLRRVANGVTIEA